MVPAEDARGARMLKGKMLTRPAADWSRESNGTRIGANGHKGLPRLAQDCGHPAFISACGGCRSASNVPMLEGHGLCNAFSVHVVRAPKTRGSSLREQPRALEYNAFGVEKLASAPSRTSESLVLPLRSFYDLQTIDCETRPVGAKNVSGRQCSGEFADASGMPLAYHEAVGLQSPASPRSGAPWVSFPPGFPYAEGVIQRMKSNDANISGQWKPGWLESSENTVS